MNPVWLLAGLLIGVFNLYTQWQVIRRLSPARASSAAAVLLILLGSAVRLMLIGVVFLAAVRGNFLNGLLLIAGFLIARWGGLVYMHNK